jgi:hypothetical protein
LASHPHFFYFSHPTIFYCFDKDYTRLNESMPTLEAMFGWWLKNTAHGNKLVEWHSFKKILSMLAL